MQEILLTGNVGKDAETKEYQGKQFATFSIGCTTRRKNGDDVKETTNWYDCATDNMKVAQFIKKGTKILVRGNFKLDQYHSDTLNKWVPTIKVYAQDIELLSPKKDDSTSQQPSQPAPQNNAPTPPPVEMAGNGGDDLPF
jgi:single-strand DNA-binding protein